jgi:hypothetical protein
MAKPYFTGDYGSALARVDTRPYMEAARYKADAIRGVGANVGGMIQQYGLNKEKRRKEEEAAMAGLKRFTPEELTQFTQDDPKLAKAVNLATTEGASPKHFQLISASIAPYLEGKTRRSEEDARKTIADMQKFNLTSAENTQNAVRSAAEDSLALIREVKDIQQQSNKSGFPFKPTPVIARLLAREDQYRVASKSGNPTFLPKPDDPTTDEYNQLKLGAAKQTQEAHDAMIEGMGGLDAYVQFEVEGRKLNHDKIRSSMELMAAQGKTMELNAVARVIAAGNIDLGKKYLDLHSQRGKLMDETLTDSMGGGEITFKEYLKLNGTEGDNDYPLTGPNAGFAGKLNARYKALGLEMQQTIDATPVQADDGSGGAGAQGKVGWMGMNKDHKVGDTFPLDKDSDDPWAGKNVEVLNVDPNTRRTSIKLLDDPRVWASEIQEGINQGESIQRIYNSESNSAKRKWMEQEYGITPTAPPGMGGGYHHPGY